MTITIRITLDIDIDSAAKCLMVAEPFDIRSIRDVKAALAAVLASEGLDGALRRHRNLRLALADAAETDAHNAALAACRLLAQRAYPPPKPRPPRPTPMGRPLIDILADVDG